MDSIKKDYIKKKDEISSRLENFRFIKKEDVYYELLFCLLTPQSNAKKCWQAVEQIKKAHLTKDNLINILKTKTRFHNNKSRYILETKNSWGSLKDKLNSNLPTKELRNWISENIKGLGLKEASHFLRNIGKSNNQIAILDRHILRNLKKYSLIKEEKIKSKKDYLEIEEKFLNFSRKVGIPADHLDLFFWSRENGEIFK